MQLKDLSLRWFLWHVYRACGGSLAREALWGVIRLAYVDVPPKIVTRLLQRAQHQGLVYYRCGMISITTTGLSYLKMPSIV